MKDELQTIDQSGNNISAVQQPVNPWVAIIQQSVEKGSDIVTIEKFIHLQREEEDRQSKRAFNKAMSNLQGSIPEISKTGVADYGNGTKYSFDTLNDIGNAIRPKLQATGLSYSFAMNQSELGITVRCTVSHESGHSESNQMTAPPDKSGSKNAIQQVASTNTYLQRYTLKAAFGISSADDDGAASTKLAADKIDSSMFDGWKAAFHENIKSHQTLDALDAFKTQAVNYAAKHDPSFCVEIYKKFEEIKQAKEW